MKNSEVLLNALLDTVKQSPDITEEDLHVAVMFCLLTIGTSPAGTASIIAHLLKRAAALQQRVEELEAGAGRERVVVE